MLHILLVTILSLLLSSSAWAQTFGGAEPFSESNLYEGFFISTTLGYGNLTHESFNESPSFTTLGLGLGFDYYFASNFGLGLSTKASYNHQIVSGEKVGGTYSGLDLNPINARLLISVLSLGLAFEYHILPSYQVSKTSVTGDKIK